MYNKIIKDLENDLIKLESHLINRQKVLPVILSPYINLSSIDTSIIGDNELCNTIKSCKEIISSLRDRKSEPFGVNNLIGAIDEVNGRIINRDYINKHFSKVFFDAYYIDELYYDIIYFYVTLLLHSRYLNSNNTLDNYSEYMEDINYFLYECDMGKTEEVKEVEYQGTIYNLGNIISFLGYMDSLYLEHN